MFSCLHSQKLIIMLCMTRRTHALVVSNRWPPAGSPTPMLLHQLFKYFPKNSCHVVCGPGLRPKSNLSLEFNTNRFTIEPFDRIISFAYQRSKNAFLFLSAKYLESVIRQIKPNIIYGHYPDGVFLTAAYFAAKRNKIPLVVNFDILWEGNRDGELSDKYENEIISYAERCFAITESLCSYMQNKHGKQFELMPHTIDVDIPNHKTFKRENRQHIVHLGGAIYPDMNLDSVKRFLSAMKKMDYAPSVELVGATPSSFLKKWQIDDQIQHQSSVPRDELIRIQQNRSILFLPEAFHSTMPKMVQHNFPTKALEYMISGTPILVHAPNDSYLSYCAKKYDWALVVDREDENEIVNAVTRLLNDDALCDNLTKNALNFIQSRRSKEWSLLLQKALGIENNVSSPG